MDTALITASSAAHSQLRKLVFHTVTSLSLIIRHSPLQAFEEL